MVKHPEKMIFAAIAGLLYIVLGILQSITGFGLDLGGWTEMIFIFPDAIGGLAMVVIGAVYFYGVYELATDKDEGVAFVYVATWMGLGFMILYLLIMLGDAFEAYILKIEDFEGWTPLDDIRPGIYLGVISFIGFAIWGRNFRPNDNKPVEVK